MKRFSLMIAIIAAMTTTGASAQSANLTGTYQCVQGCHGGLLAYVTQNGAELNMVTEAGVASRAWPDWFSPPAASGSKLSTSAPSTRLTA
ncbi:hypothetical protein ACQPTN_14230 [Bradyrhizobium sp. 13971]